MGDMVSFASNGGTCEGYLAVADGDDGAARGVVVIRSGGAWCHTSSMSPTGSPPPGSALAPDLYRGESTTEPDGAGKLMMALNLGRAAKDLWCRRPAPRTHRSRRGRHRGVLHGRRPRPRARLPSTGRGQGDGAVLRRDPWPTAQQLVGIGRQGGRRVRRARRVRRPGAGGSSGSRSYLSWARTPRCTSIRAATAFFNDTRPGSTTPSTRRRRSAGPSGVPHRAVSATPGVGL